MGDLIELTNAADVKFEAFSLDGEMLKASVSPDGKKMIHGVASSTTKDLHGDTILLSALEDMERSAVGLTVYLNHKYEVPDDVGGTITKAIIRQKGVDEKGDPNYQLEVDIEVEDDNEAAVKTHKFISKGRKLGLSIGAMIPKDGAKRQKDGTYIIEHLLLLELSMVGIPANPKSWIDYAASALRGMVEKATTDLGSPTLEIKGGEYHIRGSMKDVKLDLGEDSGESPVEPEVTWVFEQSGDKTRISSCVKAAVGESMAQITITPVGTWDLADPDDKLLAIATVGEEVVAKATVWVETRDGDTIVIGEQETKAAVEDSAEPITLGENGPEDITVKGSCPTCGKGHDATGCDDSYHKAAPEPDVTDAKIRIIEVDTDDPSSNTDSNQGASSSEPDDAEYAAPEADVTAEGQSILEGAGDELLALSINQLRAVALRATTDLVEAKRLLGEEKIARLEAERQRDAVTEAAAELVQRAAKVIDKVAAAPLPRKAVLKDVKAEFSSSVEQFYGTEFARALAGK